MRRKPPHTERAAASHEAAALFCSTLSCFDLPLNANFEKITPLCAFACGRVRLFHAFKKRLWLRTHSGRPPPRQSEFLKFQIDRRKQPWLTTKPEPKNSERKLRELGVDEDTIQRLHTYDWAQFNKERQYLQRQVEWSPYVELISAQDLELPVEDTEALLDSIEDMELFSLLHNVDKLTLEILFMKMDGYGSKEISEKTGLSVNAIDLRIFKLKKKLKNFL